MSSLKNLSSVTTGVVFVVFAVSLVSTQDDLEFSPHGDFEQLDEIQQLLQKVQALYAEKIAPKTLQGEMPDEELEEIDLMADAETNAPTPCKCVKQTCTCCKRVVIKTLGINHNYCLSLTYVPAVWAINIVIKSDKVIILSTHISVKNIHAVCAPVKCKTPGVKVCIKFSKMLIAKGFFSGCSKITVHTPKAIVGTFDLGCFRMKCPDATEQMENSWAQMMGPEPVEIDGIPMEELTPADDSGKM